MSNAAALAPGFELAGFRIDAAIGRGGMGVVYQATQLSLERRVAVKVIAPEFAADPRFQERFVREARLAASLEHPHLLPVYEAGEQDGVVFLAMKLVEGVSLAELLEREGRLEASRAVGLVAQLASALEVAHTAGLVHRDVKPGNVLVTRTGGAEHAFLCDFGLSRRVVDDASLTRPEGFVGSAAYAAPEQIRGEAVDGRADVYALGCVLFESLTGRRPFERDDELAAMWAHMHEPPPRPSAIDPTLQSFDAIVARALAKEPAERASSSDFERLPVGDSGATDRNRAVVASVAAQGRLPVAATPTPTVVATSNLPTPPTGFIGRERELAAVVGLLSRDDVRLASLTGPGGTGKTRLAVQAARQVREAFPAGVFWVPLAPLRDPVLVPSTMSQALGLQEQPGWEPVDALCERLAGKRLLVLLDNAEHLLPDLARTVSQVHAVAGPTVLVTSRERLNIAGEHVYAVPELDAEDAVELFLTRAAAAGVLLERAAIVDELCARLERLPLALELAAARTVLFTPEQLLDRLSQRLDLLKGGRDTDPRQQTLHATIEWSYELLDAEEQRLFRALSVFAGGCTYEAAERVAGATPDTLQSLLEKSLLRRRDTAPVPRYLMLETTREYAQMRLRDDPAEAEAVLDAFLGWLDDLVGEVDEDWIERDQLEWFTTLEVERANFMHGVTACRSRGRSDRGLRLVVAADQFIDARGPYAAFLELLERLRSGDPTLECLALLLRMRLLLRMGRHAEVEAVAEASAASMAGNPIAEGRLLSLRSFNTLYEGDAERATALADKAVALTRLVNDRRGLADALISKAVAASHVMVGSRTQGDFSLSLTHLRESLGLSESLGDRRTAEIARLNMAIVLLSARKPHEACQLLHTTLANVRPIADPFLLSAALDNLAIGLAAVGDPDAARLALREALELELAQVEDSLRIEGLLLLAIGAASVGAPERAITLWGAGARLSDAAGYVVGPELQVYVTDRLEQLRSRPDFEHHWEHGRSLSADAALEFGLLEPR